VAVRHYLGIRLVGLRKTTTNVRAAVAHAEMLHGYFQIPR